ncbi:hypothetical protein, partial [Patulibacter minatonensis]|uniref:hypothetical protein n=1 Tax=Patulibacter minatonensis TaxID=298163 RepID=UPI000561248D
MVLRRPSRASHPGATAVLAAFAILVASGVAGCGGGDPFEIRRGSPDAGFPLRGELASDTGLLRDAGAAWLARDRDRDDGRIFRGRRDATALWAGRIGGHEAVVLAHRGDAALVHRAPDGDWDVSPSTIYGTELRPGLAAFSEAVLTAARAPSAYRAATPGAAPVEVRDGLWATDGASGPAQLPEGVVVLGDGVATTTDSPTGTELVVTGFALTGNRSPRAVVSTALRRRVLAADRPAGLPFLQRLVAASVVAADRPPAEAGVPEIALVQDGRLPDVGPATVITTTYPDRRGTVSAGIGGTSSLKGGRAVVARLEDQRAAAVSLRGRDGPALGSVLLTRGTGRGAVTRLLVAGDRRV